MSDARASQPLWRRVIRWCVRFAERVLALIGLAAIVYHSTLYITPVVSPSMAPTLKGNSRSDGDWVLTERLSFRWRDPRRWEVATIRCDDGMVVMKRVVGLPGETVQILRGGRIVIDGEPINPPTSLRFLKYLPYGNVVADQTACCGDGFYVLGDDSKDSDDSRFNGPVARQNIIGRAWLIIAPQSRRGFVNAGE